ncbi:MAG TPA: right-handed parallel beta-helix repeat-containing protein, partial [Gemmatimonadaceae bacterium]|nr:right-handed parallel beta-helix repeat-containing protein [Gemmatimonadaceae bacterium]
MRTAKRSWPAMLASMVLTALVALGCRDGANPVSSARTLALTPDLPAVTEVAFTQEVCGVIPVTLVITENTRLTCDVVCTNTTGPCIQFGRNNVTLFLAGFTMTGPASPPANCAANPSPANPYDGVSTATFDRVKIRGPGMIQKFRRHGIFMFQTDKAVVEHVTSHYNCFSGILMAQSHENYISENVSVRNSSASGPAPCGGNCLVSSNGNRVRRNHFNGNGSVAVGDPLGTPNDFGVGLT